MQLRVEPDPAADRVIGLRESVGGDVREQPVGQHTETSERLLEALPRIPLATQSEQQRHGERGEIRIRGASLIDQTQRDPRDRGPSSASSRA